MDIGRSSLGRAKTKRRSGKEHRNIVSEWNRRNGGRWDPQGGRKTHREEEAPRVVPGGPRPVETAQRLKARGIILL